MNDQEAALKAFESEPWDDNPWGPIDAATEEMRHLFINNYRAAFRAGFRAGQEHTRDARGIESAAPLRSTVMAASADSELGIELARIRDRLNALERRSHEHILLPTDRTVYTNRGADPDYTALATFGPRKP